MQKDSLSIVNSVEYAKHSAHRRHCQTKQFSAGQQDEFRIIKICTRKFSPLTRNSLKWLDIDREILLSNLSGPS